MILGLWRKREDPERTQADPWRKPQPSCIEATVLTTAPPPVCFISTLNNWHVISKYKWEQLCWAIRYFNEILHPYLANPTAEDSGRWSRDALHCSVEGQSIDISYHPVKKKFHLKKVPALPSPTNTTTSTPPSASIYLLARGNVPSPLSLTAPVFQPPIVFSLYLHLLYLMTWQLFRSLLYEAPSSVTYVHRVIWYIITNQWILLLYSGERIQFASPRETDHTTSYPSSWWVWGCVCGGGGVFDMETQQQCICRHS